MKLLLLSDTHGLVDEITEMVSYHEKDMDGFFHCGDSELKPKAPQLSSFQVVKGNCDFTDGFPDDIIKEYGDYRIYMTHGHLYSVKFSPLALKYRAEEVEANLVFFGHTHVAVCHQEGSQLFINPGSLRLPRNYPQGTYAILDLKPNFIVDVNFYNKSHQILDDMSKTFILK